MFFFVYILPFFQFLPVSVSSSCFTFFRGQILFVSRQRMPCWYPALDRFPVGNRRDGLTGMDMMDDDMAPKVASLG